MPRASILQVHISLGSKHDTFFWRYSKSGDYTVSLAHEVTIEEIKVETESRQERLETNVEGQKEKCWKGLWKLDNGDRCEGIKTEEHTLLLCPKACEVWKYAPIYWDGLEKFVNSGLVSVKVEKDKIVMTTSSLLLTSGRTEIIIGSIGRVVILFRWSRKLGVNEMI
ncbi:hypothetical protein ACH5RR_025397 [Cinchona calisaya]|uniref:Uncharacterized protein n=1 Tax=Cinchona calisaya TaxID=153742 RepID=A0ABD2Z2W4_9GENT